MLLSFNCKNLRLLCHCYFRHLKPFSTFAVLEKKNTNDGLLDKSKFQAIYEFPYIKYQAAIIRSKKRVPICCIAITPFLHYIDNTNVSVFVTLVAASSYFLTGIAFAKLSENIVGKIYISTESDKNEVMISSINFSGNRVDRIHKLNEIVNVDCPTNIAKIFGFIRLVVKNSDVYYDVNVINCKFIRTDVCNDLLGWPLLQNINEMKSVKDEKESNISKYDK